MILVGSPLSLKVRKWPWWPPSAISGQEVAPGGQEVVFGCSPLSLEVR